MKYICNHDRFTAHGVVSPPVSGEGGRGGGVEKGWREGTPVRPATGGGKGRGGKGTPSLIQGCPLPYVPLEQIHTCENITSHHTTYTGSNKYI